MALLSDPKQREKLVNFIKKYSNKFSVLCYVIGIVWMLALAYKPLNAGTYFSENALLPGLVEREFYYEQDCVTYTNQVIQEVNKDKVMPTEWLRETMMQLGLESFIQNFTVQHPFLGKTGKGKQAKPKLISGTNVYGILRAPKVAGTEAVVFSIPFRKGKDAKNLGGTLHGIGLMLSLAKFFRKQTFWSKDVIFLITEHEHLGIQAWLDAYHHTETEYIQSSVVHGRSGALIGAINLELGSSSVSNIDIKMEGLNGLLPNLDLINLAIRLCRKERVPVTLQNRHDPNNYYAEKLEGFQESAKTMLLNMANQASGKPTGNHGLFHTYHIEAITLKGMESNAKGNGYLKLGRVLEGVFRSLNNLLERFHQSFFFYLLPATDRYVSIGLYMPPFGLLVLVPALQVIALWITMTTVSDDENVGDKVEKKTEVSTDKKEDKKTRKREAPKITFSAVIPTILVSHFTGLLLFWSPETCARWAHVFSLVTMEAVTTGLLAYFIGATFLPYLTRRSISRAEPEAKDELLASWPLLKCLGLIWHGVLMGGLAMMNFSLGYLLTLVTVPVYCCVKPTNRRIHRLIQAVLVLLVSPMSLLFILMLFYHTTVLESTDVWTLLTDAVYTSRSALFDSVVNSYIHGNWTYPLAALLIFPNWLMFWSVLWQNP